MRTFEDLPSEILVLVLLALSSPVEVHSLIRASPLCWSLFCFSKSRILAATLNNAVAPEVRLDALRVLEVHRFLALEPPPTTAVRFRDEENAIRAILDKSASQTGQCDHTELPSESVLPLTRTWCTIDYFVQGFADDTLRSVPSENPNGYTDAETRQLDLVDGSYQTGISHDPEATPKLSRLEQLRLQQAFLRYDFYCSIMHSCRRQEHATALSTALTRRVNNAFLDALEVWQMEELTCIFNYIYARVETVFDSLEEHYVECVTEGLLGDEVPPAPAPKTISHSAHFFRITSKQRLHAQYIGHLLSKGLASTRHLLQAKLKQQRKIIFDNLRPEGDTFINSQWRDREPTSRINRPHVGQRNVPRVVPDEALSFTADALGKPNLGFAWAHGFTSTNVCGRRCDHELRSLGYVFWDEPRLRAMGVMDHSHSPEKWARRGRGLAPRQRRNRSEEPSAEKILLNMGFSNLPILPS